MRTEHTRLVETLRQISFEAGCVLLGLGTSGTVQHCTARYNRLYTRLRTLAPNATCIHGPLPNDASAVDVRIAARDAATRVQDSRSTCPSYRFAA